MRPAPAPHIDWPSELAGGLAAMSLHLDADQQERLVGYLELLERWNKVFNLTAVRDRADMVRRHLLDSLSILPWVVAGPVLDVGTGAGLPGIPLAIARPQLAFSLLDSNGKKTRFVRQVVAELGLANVEVINGRVEALARPRAFTRITSRAFATLADMLAGSDALLADGGRWLAMKGAAPLAELRELPNGIDAEVVELQVPGEPGRRHLVIMQRAG
ncbi:MAG: 16S rRNA (guanine(527)-N(7))-methyltransferase RsmG [Chromatiaceae bacterium]|nr:16S rRNA (guanine(527)-N(7))-methyltransferase RsmG [Gammaproteobacteria bacterium]MCP5300624.1 16S rRNA (guanine(527)-N(7))-methyltransferase RsmG [Chromatiaceae bacterium]MCP5422696.1 16S rRNA (guanine(527)-N(7))-methyltransferase RsmG [Chromatiaceae bacterium]